MGETRRALLPLPLAVLVGALSCSSTHDDRGGAVGGNGSGASGGHASHGGSGGVPGAGAGGMPTGGGSGGTAPQDGGAEAADSDAADGAAADARPAVNGCIEYVDRTGGDEVQIMPWEDAIASDPQRCMKVRVGQTVSFVGDFDEHPLAPRGGDTPSPIAEQTQLNQVGVFGFFCTAHPSMNGAIWVVEP